MNIKDLTKIFFKREKKIVLYSETEEIKISFKANNCTLFDAVDTAFCKMVNHCVDNKEQEQTEFLAFKSCKFEGIEIFCDKKMEIISAINTADKELCFSNNINVFLIDEYIEIYF